MLLTLGLPGGMKRYLDDVIIALGCNVTEDVGKVFEFLCLMPKNYPPPLKLNMEPIGDQEFLEGKVTSSKSGLHVRLYNQVVADLMSGREPYRRRLGTSTTVYTRDLKGLGIGIATRCAQYATSSELLKFTLEELNLECQGFDVPDAVYSAALRSLCRREDTSSRHGKSQTGNDGK